MIKVDGKVVAEVTEEWGTAYTSTDGQSYVLVCDDEQDARAHQALFGGTVKQRKVYALEWVAVDNPD